MLKCSKEFIPSKHILTVGLFVGSFFTVFFDGSKILERAGWQSMPDRQATKAKRESRPWVKPLSPERVRKAALDAVVRLGGGYQQEN